MPLPFTISPETVPLQLVVDPRYADQGVELWVKREDQIHPLVSGNKWRKLKYVLAEAQDQGVSQLVTFGGAHSNHLLAVAAVGHAQAIRTVGVVRGEQPKYLSPTLQHCTGLGMELHFVTRQAYRRRGQSDYQHELLDQLGGGYLIPEGGSSILAIPGVAEVWDSIPTSFDWLVTAVGTGGTLAGLASRCPINTQVLGVVVLKGYGGQMERDIESLLTKSGQTGRQWRLEHSSHHGGYAKASPELLAFMSKWPSQHGFFLDPVYTGKVFYFLHQRILAGYFPRGTRLCVLHTGGLQGIRGFNQRWNTSLPMPEHLGV